jgi:nucleoid-associated protein YgaU
MSWEKLAQNRIEEALAQGEFDDLPGRGQPLNLDEYFALPPTERVGAALLKNANVLPPEAELLKSAARLEAQLTASTDPAERTRLQSALQETRVAFALAMERRKRREPGS